MGDPAQRKREAQGQQLPEALRGFCAGWVFVFFLSEGPRLGQWV